MSDYLLRSMLFVPAYKQRFIEKAIKSDADAIIFDMEDSVPPEMREVARENLVYYFQKGDLKGKQTFIRINELGTEDFKEDMAVLAFEDLTGYMLPKISSANDIHRFEKTIENIEAMNGWSIGKFKLTPLIETTMAICNINEIASASKRLVALCFGGEDFLTDSGSIYSHQNSAFVLPRAVIVNAARAYGLLPIDTPYLKLSDLEGLYLEERESYRIGFAGGLMVSPNQIDAVNKAFTPDEDEVEDARGIMSAIQESIATSGLATTRYKTELVGPPMRKRAEMVLKQMALIDKVTGTDKK